MIFGGIFDGTPGIIKPEYLGVVERVDEQFNERLARERSGENNLGKYLIGSSQKPFSEVTFKVVESERGYRESERKRREDEILVGEKI